MSTERQVAIIFILVGMFAPLYLLIFVSGYDAGASLSWNLNHMEIVIRDKYWTKPSELDEMFDNLNFALKKERRYLRFGSMILKPKIAIRYKNVILFNIFFIFVGTGFMSLSDNRAGRHYN
jgi:hypothetical protein